MLMRIANGSAGIYHCRSIGNGSPVCATLAAQLMAPPVFATLASHLIAPRGVGHVQAGACSGHRLLSSSSFVDIIVVVSVVIGVVAATSIAILAQVWTFGNIVSSRLLCRSSSRR